MTPLEVCHITKSQSRKISASYQLLGGRLGIVSSDILHESIRVLCAQNIQYEYT